MWLSWDATEEKLVEMGKSGGSCGGLISNLFLRKYYGKTERVIALSTHACLRPSRKHRPLFSRLRSSPFSVFSRFPAGIIVVSIIFERMFRASTARDSSPSVVPRGFADIPSGSRRNLPRPPLLKRAVIRDCQLTPWILRGG